MVRAESQLQVRIRLAILNLAASWRITKSPADALTSGVRWLQRHRPSRESVSKDVRHVIPDLAAIKVVCEDGVADIRLEEAVVDGADLDGYAAASGVAMEDFAIGLILRKYDFGPDGTADGPEVDG